MGLNQIVLLAADVAEKPLGERMQTALLNTVMGILIVFLALWFISGLISCFKFIHKAEMNAQRKKEAAAAVNAPAQPAPVAEAVVEEEDLSDDLELVAVITAAIHAYEEAQGNEVPANGLMVRSIRKVNRSKWLNA